MVESVRVIVGINGSLSSLAALYRAEEEARARSALLVPLTAWTPSDGSALRPFSELEYAAHRRLDTAFEQAFGGFPEGIRVRPTVVRGDAGPALTAAADRPGDVLVLGSGGHRRLQRFLHGSTARYCRANAVCEVITVSPSELLESLELTARSGAPLPLRAVRSGPATRSYDA
ncbi:universal stress protein [Kitasatospora sp. MAP5-34]|uniref:universal stress protein n=1 Tax=Kitasatospora sp. MAP5-34 TaxID=3035102 RepID=UPI0024747C62|nr:universal stress protein [Kitasatospora sp. MAP5-34]MDH6580556.1 nucleotide-binding universal stress UspA family protein [Kitasatospora sp. MAP5-34]